MSEPIPIPQSKSKSLPNASDTADLLGPDHASSRNTANVGSTTTYGSPSSLGESPPTSMSNANGAKTPGSLSTSPPPSPGGRLSRTGSFSDEGFDTFPPLERLTFFDFMENLALPQRLERLQQSIQAQTEKVRRQQQRLKSTGLSAKDRVVDEWRRRIPTPDEQLDKYKRRMREGVERLGRRWNASRSITTREKISFIAGVLNIFISGYIVGAKPQWFHLWYTVQLLYFMPIRWYTYHKKGYHYFLADLCYFVNGMTMLSIWCFPRSKRLFISTYCLAYGNNAVAIAMWRNSLVFHSLDKVTSLFIHIMPCVTLHCLVHLLEPAYQAKRFPAIHAIKISEPSAPEYYSLFQMMLWASVPYMIWQLSYHTFITVRRREKIAAGRPTSFTWLRKSYAPTWIGKFVLSLPVALQEPAFMCIQYVYALLTMMPCPLWFWSRWASAAFLSVVFIWSIHNGATYYIDVFGKRFQNELEALRRDVAKWQGSPDALRGMSMSGLPTPTPGSGFAGTPGLQGPVSGIDGILGGAPTPGATTPLPGAGNGMSPSGPAASSGSPQSAPPTAASAPPMADISLGAPGMSISSGLGAEESAVRWRGESKGENRNSTAGTEEEPRADDGQKRPSNGIVVNQSVDGWVEGREANRSDVERRKGE